MHLRILFSVSFFLLVTCGYSQLSLDIKNVKCKGEKNGKVTVVGVGSASLPIKNYSWSTGNSGKEMISQDQLIGGTYTVTVTDANDCTATAAAQVLEPAEKLALTIRSASGEFFLCGESTLIVTATGRGGSPPLRVNGADESIELEVTKGSFGNGPKVLEFVLTDNNGCELKKKQGFAFGSITCSRDPNDISGPIGVDDDRWVAAKDPLSYLIRFENDALQATASAQVVKVIVPVPEHINPFTLRLGDFGFGPYRFDVPDNSTFYQTRLDLLDELNLYVDVTAGLDVVQNTFFWILTSIDPVTNQLPIDPLIGFLPVNDTLTGSGEGFMYFTALPEVNSETGDTVMAQAEIIFDVNDPILTNLWTNILDAVAPVSNVMPLQDSTENPVVEINFAGNDDPGGVGLHTYSLYASRNSVPYTLVAESIGQSPYLFYGEPGDYRFFSRAYDKVGNAEPLKNAPETSIYVLPVRSIVIDSPATQHVCVYDSLHIAWTRTVVDSVHIEMSLDSGFTYFPLDSSRVVDHLVIYIADTMVTKDAVIRITDAANTMLVTYSTFFSIDTLPIVEAGYDRELCLGSSLYLLGNGANTYTWMPDSSLNNAFLNNPRSSAVTNTMYHMVGTSVYGCSNMDSVLVTVHDIYLDTVIHLMCNQDSVFVGGAYQNQPGYYTDDLVSIYGCDSVVVTEVVLTGPCVFPSPYVYVDKDATGLNNGTSWENAFHQLSDALKVAHEYLNADEIWVAEGDYYPHASLRDSSFVLFDSIKIYGGFIGVEASREERTADASLVRLSGDINIVDTLWDNSYHSLTMAAECISCIVDGVTITYGYADQPANSNNLGAGVINFGTGYFNNVIFERNFASDIGAAIYSSGAAANLIIENCTFLLNTSSLGRDVVNLDGAQMEFKGLNSVH